MPVVNPSALIDNRVDAIRAMHRAAGISRAEIDVSGGIDSAVMLTLLVRALGADEVTAAFLGINSSSDSLQRARAVADELGARLIVDDLSDEFDRRIANMVERLVEAGYDRAEIEKRTEQDPTVLGSIRSCLRAPLGRGYNRLTGGGIRHGTGNECEDRFLRFYQKGGDGEVDTNPLEMLAKGEVYQLARALEVPTIILDALPSPDLWASGKQHNDEDELLRWTGVRWTYSRIDTATGAYRTVGSIERVSRYLDAIDDALFEAEVSVEQLIAGDGHPCAVGHPAFRSLPQAEIAKLLASAKKVEAATRHKANPNLPSLGSRGELLDASIVSDELPEVETSQR